MIKFSAFKKVWKGSSQVRQYLQKNVILENTVLFLKNCQIKNIQSFISYKKVILIFVAKRLLPFKMVMSTHKWFFTIFSKNTAFYEKLVLS